MATTLKQAFTMWANEPGNISLAARSRDAVNKVLMKKYNDVELVQFTASLAERIFKQSKEVQELKSKAASILVHVLNYGADKGWCSRPTFTYEIARPMNAGQAQDTEGQDSTDPNAAAGPSHGESLPAAETDKSTPNPCDGCNNIKGCITCVDGDQRAVITVVEPKQQQDMEEKKHRGKQARKVCQIDPETYGVIHTYDSCTAGCRAVGVKNIDRAIKKLQTAGGYYWQYPEDVPTFAERIAAKKAHGDAPQVEVKALRKPNANENLQKKLEHPKYTHFSQSQEEILQAARKDDNHVSTAAKDALAVFTDEELMAELDRRGWQGDLSRTQRITIGRRNNL